MIDSIFIQITNLCYFFRFQNFDEKKFEDGIKKCDYVTNRLPKDAKIVGKKAEIRNYWLFPLIVVRIFLGAGLRVSRYNGESSFSLFISQKNK